MEEENEEEKNKRVKLNLREYIKQRGFKIKDVAKFLGTSERNFRRILKFEQHLFLDKVVIILRNGFPFLVISTRSHFRILIMKKLKCILKKLIRQKYFFQTFG